MRPFSNPTTMTRSSVRLVLLLLVASTAPAAAQQWLNAPGAKTNQSSFRAIDEWADPTEYRNAAGSPGPKYWQQRVDYVIRTSLDTVSNTLTGSERVTYHNNSPDELRYLWFQVEQNIDDPAVSRTLQSAPALPAKLSPQARRFLAPEIPAGAGTKIKRVQVGMAAGKAKKSFADAEWRINGTVMKVMLAKPLAPGATVDVDIDWSHAVPETSRNGRGLREKVTD